jgi:hypothetical protein
MIAKLVVFGAKVTCLGTFFTMGVLLVQSACTPTQKAPPQGSQSGEVGAGSIETAPPIIVSVATGLVPQEGERPSEGNPKLDSLLNQLLEAYRRGGINEAQTFAERYGMTLDNGRVQVEMVITGEAVSQLREAIEAVGGEYQGHYETQLQALVPLDALELLAGRPDVEVIREPRRVGP